MTSSLCCIVPLVPYLGPGDELRSQHLPAFGFFCPSGLCTFKQLSGALVAVPAKNRLTKIARLQNILHLPHSPLTVRRTRRRSDTQNLSPHPPQLQQKAAPPPGRGRHFQDNRRQSQSQSRLLPAKVIPIPPAAAIPVPAPIVSVASHKPVATAVARYGPTPRHPIAAVIVPGRPKVPRPRARRHVPLMHAHVNSNLGSLCRNASQACCACHYHRSQYPILHAAHNPSVLAGIFRRPSSFPVSGLSLAAFPVTPVMSCANTPHSKGCGPPQKINQRNFLPHLCCLTT